MFLTLWCVVNDFVDFAVERFLENTILRLSVRHVFNTSHIEAVD